LKNKLVSELQTAKAIPLVSMGDGARPRLVRGEGENRDGQRREQFHGDKEFDGESGFCTGTCWRLHFVRIEAKGLGQSGLPSI